MKLFTLIASLFLFVGTGAHGEPKGSAVKTDDICSERPDLCAGGSARKVKKREARRSASGGGTACRKKGAAYNLEDAGLPICKVKKTAKNERDEDSLDELFDDMNEDAKANGGRAPASFGKPPRRISFTSYLNANANHPSVAGRIGGKQEAFIIPTRPATLTGTSTATNVGDGNADGLSMKDNPPAPPASGSTSTSGAPNN